VGTLWVGIALPDGSVDAVQFRLPATRDQMRQMSVISALNLLRQHYAILRNVS
jgi:nicotinamide mononucleotide (NMN) deamidase PncC